MNGNCSLDQGRDGLLARIGRWLLRAHAEPNVHDLGQLRNGEAARVALMDGTVLITTDDGYDAQGDTIAEAQARIDDIRTKFARTRELPS